MEDIKVSKKDIDISGVKKDVSDFSKIVNLSIIRWNDKYITQLSGNIFTTKERAISSCTKGVSRVIRTRIFHSVFERSLDTASLLLYNDDVCPITIRSLLNLDDQCIGPGYRHVVGGIELLGITDETKQNTCNYLRLLNDNVTITNVDEHTKAKFIKFFDELKESRIQELINLLHNEQNTLLEIITSAKFSSSISNNINEYMYELIHNAVALLMLYENIVFYGEGRKAVCLLSLSSIMKSCQSIIDYKLIEPIFDIYRNNWYSILSRDDIIKYICHHPGKLNNYAKGVIAISHYVDESIKSNKDNTI